MKISFEQTCPILRIFDIDKAREFYLDFLGFTLDWEHRFAPHMPLYMQVSRDGLILHLSEHHGDGSPGANVFVRMQGVEALHQEINSRGYRFMRPGIEDEPWGRVMRVIDPFGNRIQFCEGPQDD
ncbi:glyoxalase/bleomycin resistance/extradiol dioxygenase family protein [Falsochrobactrum shanghaiense]|uniref:Bleomycin resistance protein n=1 Tax=Falsochrobactrum shanghaiense TaxID=2201899 RepID=A0A316J840_9HYPH|nr:glyoxalase superfamily protein [Falsochrobactrum shanghaiense]PWL18112.1 glyoxalase/bleomycin resistance/extradiol dioxygenase family protein [Falsochrobactrum shanghaiense]